MENVVLVIGGGGFIGSHVCTALQFAGFDVVIVDGLQNSDEDVCKDVFAITNIFPDFYRVDLRDIEQFERIFNFYNNILGVIDLAGFKSDKESGKIPFTYYENNFVGTLNLCSMLNKYNVKNFILGSELNVYGGQKDKSYNEFDKIETSSPFATINYSIERMLRDLSMWNRFNVLALRNSYAIGAHESGNIGENNFSKYRGILQDIFDVAAGKTNKLMLEGGDRDTFDGTQVRDFIHVMDLAEGYANAFKYLLLTSEGMMKGKFQVVNMGTGVGTSMKQLAEKSAETLKINIPIEYRKKDSCEKASMVADPELAKELFGWKAKRSVEQAIMDAWSYYNSKLGFNGY